MLTTLRISDRRSIEVELDDSLVAMARQVAPCRTKDSASCDPFSLVRDALENPLDFPALSSCNVPGDHLAIALGEGIPQIEDIAVGILDAVRRSGIEAANATIVASDPQDGALLSDHLKSKFGGAVTVRSHDPDDDDQLCFTGLLKEDAPLLINRVLFDADIMLPATCRRPPGDRDSRGAFSGLFPAFCDRQTIQAFQESDQDSDRRSKELTDRAGWLIGAPFVLQFVPGPHDSVAMAAAGAPDAVHLASEEVSRRQWTRDVPSSASLVIATLCTDARRQSWATVARALAVANRVADPSGSVVLCTDLDKPIGESLSRLLDTEDLDQIDEALAGDASHEAWAAREIVRARQRGPVYLMSSLEDDLVEDLGIAPVQSGLELGRLAGRHSSCVLLEEPQHVVLEER